MQNPDEEERIYTQPQIRASIHVFGNGFGINNQLSPGSAAVKFFSCPLIVNDHGFDCRVYLMVGQSLDMGTTTNNMPIRFLSPELVMPQLQVGTLFHLWSAKVFAYGYVEEICEVTE